MSDESAQRPADPIVLAIDTAGSMCSAAIVRGERVLAVERQAMRHGHAEALLPIIERARAASGVRPVEFDAIAASVGPGGFTGIRVGIAAAHGIGLATGARLVGVTSFIAVAESAVTGAAAEPDRGTLLVALDSRRADLYAQLFAADRVTPLAAPVAVMPDALAQYVASVTRASCPLLVAGDAAEAAFAALDRYDGPCRIAPGSAPDALGVAAAAVRQLRRAGPTASSPLRALYLRAPDVTLPQNNTRPPHHVRPLGEPAA
jgi:tRNA threonylcarbamoyladenosine biosynthesis protein TsaB